MVHRIIAVIFCFCVIFSPKAYAESNITEELYFEAVESVKSSEVDFENITEEVKKGDIFDFKQVLGKALGLFGGEMNKSVGMLIKLISAAVVSGLLCNIRIGKEAGGTSEVCFFACYCVVASMVISSFYEILSYSNSAIDSLRIFMQSLLPVLSSLITAGGAVNVAAKIPPLFIAMQMTVSIAQSFFLPLIFTTTTLSIVNNMSAKFHIKRLIELLRQVFKWSLGILMTIFVGLLGLSGLSSAFLDGIFGKTVKYALCNFVPVVGGVLADSVSSVLFSAGIVKNTIGISGVVALVVISSAPLAKISALGIMYRLAAGVSEPAAEKRMVSMFSEVAKSITQIFAIVLVVAIMFIISIAILCMISGQSIAVR